VHQQDHEFDTDMQSLHVPSINQPPNQSLVLVLQLIRLFEAYFKKVKQKNIKSEPCSSTSFWTRCVTTGCLRSQTPATLKSCYLPEGAAVLRYGASHTGSAKQTSHIGRICMDIVTQVTWDLDQNLQGIQRYYTGLESQIQPPP
jgi:hypothetical protein